jgi:hypothetical protein
MPKNLGNCSRLAWATPWRLGGGVKERTGLLPKTTLEHKPRRFPLHRPSKILGTLMQGKPWVDKVAARGPHCAWLCYPCLKTWETTVGWPGRVHGGPVAGVEVRARWGLCVGKAKIIGCPYQTDCHPSTRTSTPPPGPQTGSCSIDTPPTRIIWTLGRMGLQGKAGALTACRGEARVQ